MSWTHTETLRQRLADERGPAFVPGDRRVCLLYPSPYRAGMSSLGFQWVHELLARAGFSVERAFLPDDLEAFRKSRRPLCTYETETPVSHFPVVAVSLAYELELVGLIRCLQLAGLPARRADRGPEHPLVVLGGPLTFSNPMPAAPFADALLLGEAEETVVPAMTAALDGDRQAFLDEVQRLPGGVVPERVRLEEPGDLPPIAKATDALLPARSRIVTPHAELSDMFLVEGERGCHRQCSFCVMRRSTNGGMRLVTPERLLELVPQHARRVGLVGAAISDHPKLVPLLQALVDRGLGLGISSLRADRVSLKPDIARLLREGGYKTLTVASDAASQRLRRTLSKGTVERHLVACAELAREHRYRVLKVYMMLGVPGEEPADIDELVAFSSELAKIHPVALGVAPFVPKLNTPMVHDGFAGIKPVERALKQLQKGLRGRVEVRATSARWAWVEAVLAQGGASAGEALLRGVEAGGGFAELKRAFKPLASLSRLDRAGWKSRRALQTEGRKVMVSPDEAQLDPDQVLAEARVHIEHEDWGTAVKMLNWIRQKRSSDQLVQGLLGWAVFNDPDKEKAKRQKVGFELLELAVSLAPEQEELHILLATCDHIQGRDQDALERCMRVAKHGGEQADAARALMRRIRGPRRG